MKKFWDKYKKLESGCWEWQGELVSKTSKLHRYGRFHLDGGRIMAHRYSWILTNGPIPDGLMVCHKCDNPPCGNPDHLFLGTNRDNILDCQKKGRLILPPNPNANKTHCKNGHPLSGDNIWINKTTGQKQCKICHKEAANRWYAKRAKDPEFRKHKCNLTKKYYRRSKENT